MDNPNAIHETVIKDIIDTFSTVKDIASGVMDGDIADTLKGSKPLMGNSSIAKASSNLTMVFPVLCSRGVSIETSSMISKAIEKRCVSMLQMLFSSWQVQDDTDIKTVQDFINQFHSNISTRVADMDDLLSLTTEAGELTWQQESAVRQDFRCIEGYINPSINSTPLSAFVVQEDRIDFDPSYDRNNNGNVTANRGGSGTTFNNNGAQSMKNIGEYFKNQVLDSDYKKANELMPTTMVVNFTIRGEKQNVVVSNAVVGVKAKLYPIGSEDIVGHLVSKNQERNWVTNFVRATTREISFLKDFVLAIDKAKLDAASLSTRGVTSSDKMWKVLERRATLSRLKRAMRQTNNMSAITTLVISQDEVEYMKKYYNIDIERVPNVINLFNSLNLMGFVVVDETLEVAKFIFDEQDPSWETISFTHLERESNDNTYKRVVNLMTKMSR